MVHHRPSRRGFAYGEDVGTATVRRRSGDAKRTPVRSARLAPDCIRLQMLLGERLEPLAFGGALTLRTMLLIMFMMQPRPFLRRATYGYRMMRALPLPRRSPGWAMLRGCARSIRCGFKT